MQKGILYVATGERFLAEAVASACRAKQLMPDVPRAIASDRKPEGDLFAHWIPIANPRGTFADKIAPLSDTPFERTLFLDTDTYLCEPVPELFELLTRYDIAMAHAPMRVTGSVPVPSSFPECNSGVIAYNMNGSVRALLESWGQYYEEQQAETGQMDDQPALRRALWSSGARISILPPEYNFRFVMPSFAGRGGVKILHGRDSDMEELKERINRSGSPRIFLPRLRYLSPRKFQVLSRSSSFLSYFIYAIGILAKGIGVLFDALKARFAK
jgi:hypothetical protein